jgi:hypothetical protein
MARSSYRFRRYSLAKRHAFIAAVLKVRDAGGLWAEALKATRRLGFKGDVSYVRVLVARSGAMNRSVSAIPESIQKRWKEQYIFLVKCKLVRTPGSIR